MRKIAKKFMKANAGDLLADADIFVTEEIEFERGKRLLSLLLRNEEEAVLFVVGEDLSNPLALSLVDTDGGVTRRIRPHPIRRSAASEIAVVGVACVVENWTTIHPDEVEEIYREFSRMHKGKVDQVAVLTNTDGNILAIKDNSKNAAVCLPGTDYWYVGKIQKPTGLQKAVLGMIYNLNYPEAV